MDLPSFFLAGCDRSGSSGSRSEAFSQILSYHRSTGRLPIEAETFLQTGNWLPTDRIGLATRDALVELGYLKKGWLGYRRTTAQE